MTGKSKLLLPILYALRLDVDSSSQLNFFQDVAVTFFSTELKEVNLENTFKDGILTIPLKHFQTVSRV